MVLFPSYILFVQQLSQNDHFSLLTAKSEKFSHWEPFHAIFYENPIWNEERLALDLEMSVWIFIVYYFIQEPFKIEWIIHKWISAPVIFIPMEFACFLQWNIKFLSFKFELRPLVFTIVFRTVKIVSHTFQNSYKNVRKSLFRNEMKKMRSIK